MLHAVLYSVLRSLTIFQVIGHSLSQYQTPIITNLNRLSKESDNLSKLL